MVSETCVLFAVNAFWATMSGRVATVSTVLPEGLRAQVLCGCSERHRSCVYCGELPHEPVPCAQMMDLCKALEEMHVNLEDLPFEQYRARDELPLMQQWARGRADDRVTFRALVCGGIGKLCVSPSRVLVIMVNPSVVDNKEFVVPGSAAFESDGPHDRRSGIGNTTFRRSCRLQVDWPFVL